MRKIFLITLVLGIHIQLYSQVPQGTIDNKRGNTLLNFGLGASNIGVPFYLQGEHFIYRELTMGAETRLLINREVYVGSKYLHTMISLGCFSNYYFDKLLELPVCMDLYAGASAGYMLLTQTKSYSNVSYTGNRGSGLYLGLHVGSRYYFSNQWAAQLELDVGIMFSGLKIGATYRF
ncbi:MAG: hypothetical protein ACOX0M_10180 [Salinivirgaceae bacterium]|jgi:hypothetical protein|nr:hypothetical protein [Bacteroidales bacterium]